MHRSWLSAPRHRRSLLVALALTSPANAAFGQSGSAKTKESNPGDLSLVSLLDTEVVTASMSEQSLAEAPAVIDVLTQEQLRARGYRTIADALASVSGLDVTSDHFQSSVGVRGITSGVRGYSRIVKVMIDGQPVSFRPSGENFLGVELIPLVLVDRIEIVRGPGSTLYGANAFLGVVNIITKSGYGLRGNSAEVAYEGGERVEAWGGQAAVTGQFGDFSVLLGATQEARSLDGYRLVPLPGRTHPREGDVTNTDATPSASAFGRLTYDTERFGTLSIEGHFQRLNRSLEFVDYGPLTHDNQSDLRNGYGKVSYRREWETRLVFEVSAALSGGGTGLGDRLNTSRATRSYIERDVGYQGYDVASSLSYRLGRKSSVVAGLDFTLDRQTILSHYAVLPSGARILNPPAGARTGIVDFTNFGAFANATLYPFSRLPTAHSDLGISAGARIDAHNIYGDNGSARGGLVYDVDDRHYAKLLFGTSFRAPSSTQLYSNYVIPGGVIGNPELRAETAKTLELALGTSPLEPLTLRATGYYTFVEERIGIRRRPPTSSVANPIYENSTPISSHGVELQADFRIPTLEMWISYSFQSSIYEKTDFFASPPADVLVRTDGFPAHALRGGATWTLASLHLQNHLELRVTGERLGNLDNNALVYPLESLTRRYALPAYVLVDWTISSVGLELWEGRESHFSLQIKNLFDENYRMPGYAGFDIPGFPRSFVLGLAQDL